jgi:hypothetical protein
VLAYESDETVGVVLDYAESVRIGLEVRKYLGDYTVVRTLKYRRKVTQSGEEASRQRKLVTHLS